jgi:hypothetical protein
MKTFLPFVIGIAILITPLSGEDTARDGNHWTRELKDRADRGKLHDAAHQVRGDSGKWNDEARLQSAPALEKRPPKQSLDDWCDRLLETDATLTSSDNTWLVFRSRQLDDNDRVWIERIERRGNQFEVVASEAIWRGKYFRNFTYYNVLAVNLGKLPPGRYEVKWIIKPLAFDKFDRPGPPAEAWPEDERPAVAAPVMLSARIEVEPPAP